MKTPLRKPLLLSFLVGPVVLWAACATHASNPNAAKYPRRPAGCRIRVFHGPAPDVKEWDDLGMARVDCYLDVGAVQCLRRLREEACRLGGDLLYDVPKKPLRPTDEGMVFLGHVAHTKNGADENKGGGDEDAGVEEETEPAAPGSVAPVEPIAPGTVATPPDGGTPSDAGR
ncbi:MAG TPA: hypothetical protein VHG72_17540 [Polyangia bacterium]|nr:hypothetical protein [Polyangia bacterium]